MFSFFYISSFMITLFIPETLLSAFSIPVTAMLLFSSDTPPRSGISLSGLRPYIYQYTPYSFLHHHFARIIRHHLLDLIYLLICDTAINMNTIQKALSVKSCNMCLVVQVKLIYPKYCQSSNSPSSPNPYSPQFSAIASSILSVISLFPFYLILFLCGPSHPVLPLQHPQDFSNLAYPLSYFR